ncbi:MAG TPA: hypothetical protein VFA26_15880 [Gemmataceae bacterium]|nr:hypothetical protein [Gemmataceae bacterium]
MLPLTRIAFRLSAALFLPACCAPAPAADPPAGKPFAITVVDEQTGRGVPLVELQTVNHIRLWTDSNGVVAFHEPGLMGRTVFFHVKSHGYEHARDGFGFRGKALDVTEGGSAKLTVKRLNVAERLYRVTGGGIYRDSLLVGRPVPLREPVLNGQVFGSDSVVNAVYRGKVYWFWGDTNRPAYPLGNFHVPGATSALPADGGLDPAKGVDLRYFLDDDGFARPTAQMPGKGPTWITGLAVLGSPGKERMFAAYVKVKPPLEIYERGLVEWNDEKKQFERAAVFDLKAPAHPGGHPFRRRVGGVDYVYFATPYPLVRVRADPEDLKRLDRYEAFTCLKPGSRMDRPEVERGAGGVRWAWKKDAPPVGPGEQDRLVKAGKLKPEEALLHLRDVDTGKPVLAHSGSVYWNEFRRRWVMIAVQMFGTSVLGEVWYAEADTPLGPWVFARKVVTHDRYSFYNPKQHPMFDQAGGRVLYFEGTYTHTFSGNSEQTPRYDYNQVMYRLDLADPRLALPVPFYRTGGKDGPGLGTVRRDGKPVGPAAFLALDRPAKGTIAVRQDERGRLTAGGAEEGPKPLFHALPADVKEPPATTAPLYEFVHEKHGSRFYTTDAGWSKEGYRREERPVCRVWRNPGRVALPAAETAAGQASK